MGPYLLVRNPFESGEFYVGHVDNSGAAPIVNIRAVCKTQDRAIEIVAALNASEVV